MNSSTPSSRSLMRSLAVALLLIALPGLASAQGIRWAQWAWPGAGNPATFTIPDGPTGRVSIVNSSCPGAFFGGTPNLGHAGGVDYPGSWFTPTPPNPTQFLEEHSDTGCGGNPVTSTVTIDFDSPISDPVFHFVNLDASEIRFLDGVSVTRLSGNSQFEVVGATLNATPFTANADGCVGNGGCGSVRVNGTFTRLRYETTDVEPAGGNGDGHFWTMSIQPQFPICGVGPYLGQGSPTSLFGVDQSTNPFTYPPLGGPSALTYDAIGLGPDRYIYGIEVGTNTLVRIGSDGDVLPVGPIAGLPVASYTAGEFGAGGFYYVKTLSSNELYRVDIGARSATPVALTQVVDTGDLALHNGLLYSAWNNVLYSINPATGAVTIVGAYAGPAQFGGMIGGTSGLFGVADTGGFYQFDPASGSATLLSASPVASGANDATATLPACVFDWADAPASYDTLNANNGPRHLIVAGGPYLGAAPPDAELDGVPSSAADGDDAVGDDEDGVVIPVLDANTTTQIQVQVGNATAATRLQGWIDWARDGRFDATDQIVIDAPVVSGANTLNVTVPASVAGGNTIARFRIGEVSSGFSGAATSGEVEDHVVAARSQVDLLIFKDDERSAYTPGADVTYTILVLNLGPGNAVGARVDDPLPAGITTASWTCTAFGGAVCQTSSGVGGISGALVDLPAGGFSRRVEFTVTMTVPPSFTGALVNTAMVTAPADALELNLADNSATDIDLDPTSVDWGDVPSSSVTLNGNGGAAHAIVGGGPYLGAGPPDAEPDGLLSAAADGDDTTGADDEDGVVIPVVEVVSGGVVQIQVTVGNAKPTTRLQAWFKWCCGSSFSDSDQVLTDVPVVNGVNTFDIPVGNSAGQGQGYARFRIADQSGVRFNGPALSGEVEDYAFTMITPIDLAITKTDGRAYYVPGSDVTYTIVVTNAGAPNYAYGYVNDSLPPGITAATWTCTGANGGSCDSDTGTGALSDFRVDLPSPAATVTFTVTMTVPPGFSGDLVNTATITPPSNRTDTDLTNNSATDTDTPPQADLAITKVSAPNPYTPGAPVIYTLVVSNLGPEPVVGATVTDALPSEFTGYTWTCAAVNGAACGAGSTGAGTAISALVDLPVGGSTTLTVTAAVPLGTTGPVTNTATVAPPANIHDPVDSNNTDIDVNAGPTADLRISKTSTPNPYVPGEPLTYIVVVTNAGPMDVIGARVADPLPAAFASFAWTCSTTGGAQCGAASGTGDVDVLVDMPVGSAVTFTSTGTVPANYTGQATNTATVTPPANTRDPVPGNNTKTTTNPPGPIADLAITKAQSPDPYVPGTPLIYTLVVRNLGPSDATNARVEDVLPGVLTNVAWTCAPAGAGAACGTPSGVAVVDALVTLPVGTTTTFTVTADVPANLSGTLINTATVTPPTTVTDPNDGNNTATVTSGAAPEADLSAVKTASIDPYVPGTDLTFTIVVSNAGPSDVLNARVQDLFPPELSHFTWTCAPSAGAAMCGTASGQSLIDVFVDLPMGGAVTFTATGPVASDVTGTLTNTATVTPPVEVRDPNKPNNASTVTLGPGPRADLRVTKTSTPNPYLPGSPITYTLVFSNLGPSAVANAVVQDTMPAALQNVTWTCSASNGTCPAANGTGHVNATVDLSPGGAVTFTIVGDVPADTRGVLVNSATIVPPPEIVDPTPMNNSGIDANSQTPIPPGPAELQITQEFPSVAPPNGLLTFRLRTRNFGGNTALNPYITGLIPPGTTFVSVTPSAGGTCNVPGNPPAPDPVTGYPVPGAATEPLKCTWPGLMKPGDTHVVEFTVRVAPGTPTGQILWSCFWTWSDTDDPHHPNNVVDAYLFVDDGQSPVGDLQVQAAAAVMNGTGASFETVGTELAVRVGTAVPMRFWVTNHGPAATRGQYALILDTPAVQIVDITLAQGWVSPSGPSSGVWDTGVVQPGQTVALDLTVKLLTPSAVELFAQRITGSPGDPNASNERASIVLDGYAPGLAGRWVAVGDVDGAGAGEIITSAGQGETPQVRVFTGTGADTGMRFFAYERPFTGGVQIASCDVNGDGISELITAPGPGRAPTIRVLNLVGGVVTELTAFDAFETGFLGGASVACADLDADGSAEVVIGAGPGRAPHVQVYSVGASSATLRATFLAYESAFTGGVRVAAGVYPGRAGWLDAFAIATTPGPGRAAELRLFTPTGAPVAQVVASAATKGVLPTLGDVNGDGQLDLLLAPDDGRPELIRIFEIDTGEVLGDVPGNLPAFPVGIRTAVGVLTGGPGQPEIVIGNGPGGHPRVRVIYWPPAGPVQRLEILPLEIP